MYVPTEKSFEELLIEQSTLLMSCMPKDFDNAFQKAGTLALDWFSNDRSILYPNSMIVLNEGKSIAASRESIRAVDKQFICNSKIDALRVLYSEGGRWHGIINLQLFGQKWGGLSLTKFGNIIKPFTEQYMKRLKLLCDMWLCCW